MMIDISTLKVLTAQVHSRASSGSDIIPGVISSLERLGYFSVRYYSVLADIAGKPSHLMLRHWSNRQIDKENVPIVPLDANNIDRRIANQSPLVLEHGDKPKEADSLAAFSPLLSGLVSALVPIVRNGNIYYEICVSKSADEGFQEEEILLLGLLGEAIASAIGEKIKTLVDLEIDNGALEGASSGSDRSEFYRSICKSVSALLEADVVSHFRYSWDDQPVRKIGNDIAPAGVAYNEGEQYEVGKNLTGSAVVQAGLVCYNNINKEGFIENVSAKCYRHYESAIGKPLSLLYLCAEDGIARHLFRAICTKRNVFGSFSIEQCETVRSFIDIITPKMQMLAHIEREAVIRNMNFNTIKNVNNVEKILSELRVDLNGNNIGEVGIFYSRVGEPTFKRAVFSGNVVERAVAKQVWTKSVDDPLIVRVLNDRVRLCDTREFCGQLSATKVPIWNEFPSLYAIRASSRDIQAILLIFLKRDIQENEDITNTPDLREFLLDIGLIASHALAASESHLRMDNATRLMGQIGHELLPTVKEISETAFEIIDEIEESMEGREQVRNGIDNDVFFDSARELIERRENTVHTVLDIAVAMAQEIDNKIFVTFESFNLYKAMKKVSDRIENQDIVDLQADGVNVRFDYNSAIKNVPNIIGDQYLIERIFTNVFRNAAKYSIPPGRGKPIVVKVNGSPQQDFLSIQVENWGSPIRAEDFDRIFDPFYRGDVHDPVRARRGMGLGLFVARRFSQVHDGQIRCVSSEPSFDDVNRRDTEGYYTTFEVRLSKLLKKGPSTFVFRVDMK
jgi:signal transduction histidine kinase